MYIYICMHIHIRIQINIHIHVRIHIHIRVRTHVNIHIHVHIRVHIYSIKILAPHAAAVFYKKKIRARSQRKTNKFCTFGANLCFQTQFDCVLSTCLYMSVHVDIYTCLYISVHIYMHMGWLRLVGSMKM